MESVTVPGYGPKPNRVLICGEAPGKEEAAKGQPFVGRAGREQEWYLSRHGLSAKKWYRTNVVKRFAPGNPDPTRKEIEESTPELWREIVECRPELIVAVGRFATRWLLGEPVEMETVHGLPHLGGAFDDERRNRARGAVVVPVYHPALGFYDNDARALIAWDYEQVAATLSKLDNGEEIVYRYDEYEGNESYEDLRGDQFYKLLSYHDTELPLAVDTEGVVEDTWSVQVSDEPGIGMVLRRARGREFKKGVEALQGQIDQGTLIVMHNAMYDLPMLQAMGVETARINAWDTMYAAYLLRLEPQGLKALAWRWCGMRMAGYMEVVGGAGQEKQLEYLAGVLDGDWPEPEERAITENDGTSRLYTPQSIEKRVEKILVDRYSGEKVVDLLARWKAVDGELRQAVEETLGPMPIGTLADVPLDEAVEYAGRDADATLRLYQRFKETSDA